jgi:succinate-semialdehyde dehydrogenase / glutarate-semialdehyde dehydrogenase
VPDHGVPEALDAAERSVAAFQSWWRTTASFRAGLWRTFFDLMLRDEAEIARLIATGMGQPVSEALGEV